MKSEVKFAYAVAGKTGVDVLSSLDPENLPSNVKADPVGGGYTLTPVDLNADGTIPSGAAVPALLVLIPDGYVDPDAQWIQQQKNKVADPLLTLNWDIKAARGFQNEIQRSMQATQAQVQAIQAQAQLEANKGKTTLDSTLIP